jgi:hypothetical protein
MLKIAGEHGRGQGGAEKQGGCRHPDGDLGETHRSHADQLSGQQIVGARDGEHDLEDARILLFDNGAGHIEAIEHDGHGEQESHQDGFVKGR